MVFWRVWYVCLRCAAEFVWVNRVFQRKVALEKRLLGTPFDMLASLLYRRLS